MCKIYIVQKGILSKRGKRYFLTKDVKNVNIIGQIRNIRMLEKLEDIGYIWFLVYCRFFFNILPLLSHKPIFSCNIKFV